MKITEYTQRKMHTNRGFTLVELLVSVFLFSIVMTISLGTLIVLIDANEKAQGVQSVMSNLSFSLDSMTRNIRTGRSYYCYNGGQIMGGGAFPDRGETQDCAGGDIAIAFTDGRTGDQMAYRLNAGAIERTTKPEGGSETESSWLPITSPELVVTLFQVAVTGSEQFTAGADDQEQPTATVLVQGYIVSDDDTDTDFTLQTNITQRTIDF